MRRRSFLKAIAASVLQATASRWPTLAQAKNAVRRRVRPADAGWPSRARWEELNQAAGGNLIRPLPLFAGCESLNGAACADVVKNIRNPFLFWRSARGHGGFRLAGCLGPRGQRICSEGPQHC
jgi:hypothetical protein